MDVGRQQGTITGPDRSRRWSHQRNEQSDGSYNLQETCDEYKLSLRFMHQGSAHAGSSHHDGMGQQFPVG